MEAAAAQRSGILAAASRAPAAASDAPLITASTIAARWWTRRGIPRTATRRLNSQFGDRFEAIAERNQAAPARSGSLAARHRSC